MRATVPNTYSYTEAFMGLSISGRRGEEQGLSTPAGNRFPGSPVVQASHNLCHGSQIPILYRQYEIIQFCSHAGFGYIFLWFIILEHTLTNVQYKHIEITAWERYALVYTEVGHQRIAIVTSRKYCVPLSASSGSYRRRDCTQQLHKDAL